MQFLRKRTFVLFVQNRMIFAVEMLSTVSNALHCQYPIFQISTKLRQVFPRYELSKIGLVSWFVFFFFSSWYESYHKVEMGFLIALRFGAQKGGVRAHLGTEFG